MPFFFYLFLSQLTYVLSIPRSLQRRFESLSDNCTVQVARNLPPRRLLNRLHCRQRQEKKVISINFRILAVLQPKQLHSAGLFAARRATKYLGYSIQLFRDLVNSKSECLYVILC